MSFKRRLQRVFAEIFRLFPINRKKAVFCNFMGRGFADNPRYIAEALHAQAPDMEMIWLVRKGTQSTFPDYIKPVRIHWPLGLYHVVTAAAVVSNVRHSLHCPKRKGQTYLQTWHGGLALKLVEKEVEHKLKRSYVRDAKRDGQLSDGIIAACRMQEEQFKKSFWLHDRVEILQFGCPRNDVLIRQGASAETRETVTRALGIEGKNIVFYVPTFRDDKSTACYDIDYEGVIEACEKRFGGEWVMLIRLHPNAQSLCSELHFSDRVINVTTWPDINELLIASDLLISDYSSAMFDAMLLGKPVFLCALDYEAYNDMRGFAFDFQKFPFRLSFDRQGLKELIDSFNREEYEEKVKTFMEEHPFYDDGNAAKRVSLWLIKKVQ